MLHTNRKRPQSNLWIQTIKKENLRKYIKKNIQLLSIHGLYTRRQFCCRIFAACRLFVIWYVLDVLSFGTKPTLPHTRSVLRRVPFGIYLHKYFRENAEENGWQATRPPICYFDAGWVNVDFQVVHHILYLQLPLQHHQVYLEFGDWAWRYCLGLLCTGYCHAYSWTFAKDIGSLWY